MLQYNKPMLGDLIDYSLPLAPGLVGHWPMNEGTGSKINDLSGNGLHGARVNSPVWAIGKYGHVIDCAAIQARFQCPDPAGILDFTSENFTVVMELTPGATQSNYGVIIARGDWKVNGWYIATVGNDPDDIVFATNQSGQVQETRTTGNILLRGSGLSKIYTFVREGTAGRIYVDGVEVDYAVQGTHLDPTSAIWDLFLGGESGSPQYDFDGKFGFVTIWNRALSAAEIETLYRYSFAVIEDDVMVGLWPVVEGGTSTKTFTSDGYLQETNSKTFTSDGYLVSVNTKTFTSDGYLVSVNTKTFTSDGYLTGIGTKTFTSDANLTGVSRKTFISDGYLVKVSLPEPPPSPLDRIDYLIEKIDKSISVDGFLGRISYPGYVSLNHRAPGNVKIDKETTKKFPN